MEMIVALTTFLSIIAPLLGFDIDLIELESQLTSIVQAVFVVLLALGVCVDTSTSGVKDNSEEQIAEALKDKDILMEDVVVDEFQKQADAEAKEYFG